eukprot:gene1596-12721_t
MMNDDCYCDVFSGEKLINLNEYKNEVIDDVMIKVQSQISSEKAEAYIKNLHQTEDTQYKNLISKSNVILEDFGYSKISFKNEEEFLLNIKGYITKLKKYLIANNPDRLEPFLLSIHKFLIIFLDKSVRKFSELEFFTKKESMIIIQEWSEDGIVPFLYFFKDGLKLHQ